MNRSAPAVLAFAYRRIGACLVLTLVLASCLSAAQFDIRQYGATPNDPSDDTQAIRKALEACATAGGGTVFVPAGTYLVEPAAARPAEVLTKRCERVTVVKRDQD